MLYNTTHVIDSCNILLMTHGVQDYQKWQDSIENTMCSIGLTERITLSTSYVCLAKPSAQWICPVDLESIHSAGKRLSAWVC